MRLLNDDQAEVVYSANAEEVAPGFPDRLRQAIGKQAPITWGNELGISRATISGWLNGGHPQIKSLIRIAKLTNISLNWLLAGKGPMRIGHELIQPLEEFGAPLRVEESQYRYQLGRDYVLVPRYDVTAATGVDIQSEQVVDILAFKSDWVRHTMGLEPKMLALIAVRGDSMEPTLKEGDLLLLDLRDKKVRNDALYVLRLDNALQAKRIQRGMDDILYVLSDNPVYAKLTVTPEQIGKMQVIGRVVWAGRKM